MDLLRFHREQQLCGKHMLMLAVASGAPDSENRAAIVPMMAYSHTNFVDGLFGAMRGGGGGACTGQDVGVVNQRSCPAAGSAQCSDNAW
jgi:hypothetical protein